MSPSKEIDRRTSRQSRPAKIIANLNLNLSAEVESCYSPTRCLSSRVAEKDRTSSAFQSYNNSSNCSCVVTSLTSLTEIP